MLTTLLALWALTGGMVSSTIMIIVWLRDRVFSVGRFFSILISGMIAGALGGYVTHLASDPMPGIVGALSAGAILSAIVTVFTAKRS